MNSAVIFSLFLYVVSSSFLFRIESNWSSWEDSFSAIVSHTLSPTNECSWHFLQHRPQLSPPLLVHFCRLKDPFQHQIYYTPKQDRFKGRCKWKYFHYILGDTKFEIHLQNFSEVLTRAVCGGTIYLGITREASQIFYVLILLLKGMFYSLLIFLHQKGKVLIPF